MFVRPNGLRPTIPNTIPALCLLLAFAVWIPALSLANVPMETLSNNTMYFNEIQVNLPPSWTVTKENATSLEVEVLLPALDLKELRADGQIWHLLDFQGATRQGNPGQPGLPHLSQLVNIPQGMALSVQVISATSTEIPGLHLLPIQDPATKSFAYSGSAYQMRSETRANPAVEVGKPAIMAGRTVAPLSIATVEYEPKSGVATVWTSVRLQLDYIVDPEAPATAKTQVRTLPRSFARQLENQVLGFHETQAKSADMTPGFGTYVAIHSGYNNVEDNLAPLLQWRREQGYNVIVMDLSLSSASTSSIKTALQSIYDDDSIPPLEFITIFGDATGDYDVPSWHEALSGYEGGGDHYYTMLDGADILADVHIGRVSFRTADEIDTIVAKILGYEKNPPMDDTDWFGRACLQGDPSSSGITTIYTNQWVKGQLQALGWATIDTTWSGSFITPMMAQVGAGVSAYGYRGFLGTSGISNGHVNALNNGGRLAMALLPTCDSGSFASSTTCRSEAWLRAPNGGAVAAIGTATTGTHTRYNNCYYLGTWDGLLNGEDHRIGVAHTRGKNELYKGYFLAEPNRAEIWAVWNNVMGDGATEMWTGVPNSLEVTYPSQVALNGQALTVTVTSAGQPVAGANVALYGETANFQLSGLTDSAGQVVLDLPALPAGSVTVTVSGHNFLPHQGGFTVGSVDLFCEVTDRIIADGNDGLLSPGESVDLTPRLTNQGTTNAFGVTAVVSVLSGPASIASNNLTFGTINSGAEVTATAAALLTVDSDALDKAVIRLLVTATDGSEVWTSLLVETVKTGAFQVAALDLADFGGSIDPGESGKFDVTLLNFGSLDATAVSATLTMDNPWVSISDDTANFGNIAVSGTGRDLVSPFNVAVSSDCFEGFLTPYELLITYSGGAQTTINGAITVGTADTDQPSGPDAYGYYAFDNTDTGSEMAPVYQWVGIDPDHGAQGTGLGLSDFGWEQDDTKTISLPFAFGFYGEQYNEVSICSNGWLAMGTTPVNFYRNFPMTSSHSVGAMIAPFWDNLSQTENRRVYTWYDEGEHRFIVQWYNMPNDYSSAVQNFEVILLDPAYHPTGTTDGQILFQYAEVNNTDSRDGYATVGIQNMSRDIGLNYSYWNQQGPGAAPLAAGRAILFAPTLQVALPAAQVSPGAFTEALQPNAQVVQYLHIGNNGQEGSSLNFNLNKQDPLTQSAKAGQGRPAAAEAKSLSGSSVTTSALEYNAGEALALPLHVSCNSPDQEWLLFVQLDLPTGVTITGADDFATPHGSLNWNNETGEGVVTTWGESGPGGSYLDTGQTADATATLHFAAELTGDVVIDWLVSGDNWGSAPHVIEGQITLTASGPSISVSQPASGNNAVIGSTLDVSFTAANGPTLVNIDLQREPEGAWESLAAGVDAGSSPWTWNVSGEPGPYALIRVVDANDASTVGFSGVFTVGRNLDWLQLETTSGDVAFGQTLDVSVTLSANGLAFGLYEANLLFTSNGGAPVVIPVALTVSDASAVMELPSVVALLGNHPNPFNPQTNIQFTLPSSQNVSLKVYSPRGRLVRSLVAGLQPAGLHNAIWNGRDSNGRTVASGVYFYRLETDEGSFTGKMVLTK